MKKIFICTVLFLSAVAAFSLEKKQYEMLRDGDVGTTVVDSRHVGAMMQVPRPLITVYTRLGSCVLIETKTEESVHSLAVSFEDFFGNDLKKK